MNLELDLYGLVIEEWILDGITSESDKKHIIEKVVLCGMDEDIAFCAIDVVTTQDRFQIAWGAPYMEGVVTNACEFDEECGTHCHFTQWITENGMNLEELRTLEECQNNKILFYKQFGKNRTLFKYRIKTLRAEKENFEVLYKSLIEYEFYLALQRAIPQLVSKGYTFVDPPELGYAHHDDEEIWGAQDAFNSVVSSLNLFPDDSRTSLLQSVYTSQERINSF